VPHVLELTFGVDRALWALADLGIEHEGERTLWRLPSYLAPVPVAVFPLLSKLHGEAARQLVATLRSEGIDAALDDSGTIGKRYARMDEVGTPVCVTIDGETIDPAHANHGTVTVRARDTKAQERVPLRALAGRLAPLGRFPRPRFAA
jgi:glycyl-tRNA synthetase